MLDAHRLTQLAEALADGDTPDWSSAEEETDDVEQRAAIAQLRAVASIGELFATISGSSDHLRPSREILSSGATWGTLRILGHVGRGRYGDVYRAWDPSLDREVALKLVPRAPAEAGDSQIVHEGRLMARVCHPNVITIFGAQRIDDVTGLSMEFIEGKTLAEELNDRGPFGATELIKVGVELCRALAAVHDAGLVHRDVKTRNALRDSRGRVVLGDFGVGRELRDGDEMRGGLAGTPAYLAPEIFARQPATPESDIYSLGALLFQLATRRYPVEGRSLRALRDAHERSARTLLASLRPDLPTGLTSIIDRALEPNPARRFASAEVMAKALEQCVPRPISSKRFAIAAVIVAAVTMLAAAGVWSRTTASPSVPFAARDFVLMTAFDNRTGQPLLDGTLELALERELSGSEFVNVVPHGRVRDTLALMRRPADARVDGIVGREVAIRDGNIRAVIIGRVEKIGTSYAISTDIVTANGGFVARVREVARADADLMDAVDRIARRVRERLGESLASIEATATRLPKVSTASLRALQLYQQAHIVSGEEGGAGVANPRAVEQLLQEALREDPQFVMAHVLMAHVMVTTQRRDQVGKYLDLAVAAAEHGTAVDRTVARAEWHGLNAGLTAGVESRRHRELAAAAFEATLELEPDHEWSLGCLTNVYPDLGRFADAVRVSERMLELRPNSLTVLWRAARAAHANGDIESARRYADRAAALDLPIDERTAYQASWVRLFGAHQAAWQHRPQEAARIAERTFVWLRTLPMAAHRNVALLLIGVHLRLGQLRRAEELVASLDTPEFQRFTMVRILRERMDAKALSAAMRRMYADSPDSNTVISALIDAGEVDWAHRALDSYKGIQVAERYLRLVRGKLALVGGRPREAIRILESPAEGPLPWRGMPQWVDTVMTLAAARTEIGEVEQAIALLEEATQNWSEYYEGAAYGYLGLRDRLAHLYRAADRTSDAARVDAELMELLAVADEDHPIKRRLTAQTSAH